MYVSMVNLAVLDPTGTIRDANVPTIKESIRGNTDSMTSATREGA